jgi:hypothetical protein
MGCFKFSVLIFFDMIFICSVVTGYSVEGTPLHDLMSLQKNRVDDDDDNDDDEEEERDDNNLNNNEDWSKGGDDSDNGEDWVDERIEEKKLRSKIKKKSKFWIGNKKSNENLLGKNESSSSAKSNLKIKKGGGFDFENKQKLSSLNMPLETLKQHRISAECLF